MKTEDELRAAVVAEAATWVGTPYISNGMVKGKRGGTDCAMVLLAPYQTNGLIPSDFDPRPYPPQWHLHQNAERYMNHMLQWAKEVEGPPKRMPKPADLVMFKLGHVYSHGAIITKWPKVIHAIGNDRVMHEDLSTNTTGKHALWRMPQRFFSYWEA